MLAIYKEKRFDVTFKNDESPLTRADMASHDLILKGLKRLTPDLPVLSEESKTVPYDERKQWNKYWLVDPLDGTKEFLNHRDEFTINIALVEKGLPVLGVVHAPALQMTYYATKGGGAYKQIRSEEPVSIKVSDYRSDKLRIVASRLHSGEKLKDFLKRIPDDYVCLSIGSSLKLCLVAEGSAHLYPRLGPTMEWDTAAAQCIVEEAGGSVTDLTGNALTYNKPELLNPGFVVCGNPPYPWRKLI